MYRADGSTRPKPYILKRLLVIDGLSPEEVIGLRFLDAKDSSTINKKRYLAYNLGSWLKIEIEDIHDDLSSVAPIVAEVSPSLYLDMQTHCTALQVPLVQLSLLESMLDAATIKGRRVTTGHEASDGKLCAATAVISGKRTPPCFSCYLSCPFILHECEEEIRRELTNMIEETFDVDKLDFEVAYFRQGFTAVLMALGIQGKDKDNNLLLQHDARAYMVVCNMKWSKNLGRPA